MPLFIAILIFSGNTFAGSVAGFGGALEVTQLANNVQLMESVITQANQLQQQLTMVQTMLKNIQSLDTLTFQSAQTALMNLQGIIQKANGISYTMGSTNTYFSALHPDYATLHQGNNFSNQQKTWRETVYQNCNTALESADFTMSNFMTEKDALDTLKTASQTAKGQKAAIQAGNQIAAQMSGQLTELKVLTAAQIKAQNSYLYTQQLKEQASQEAENKFFSTPGVKVDKSNNKPLMR